MGCHRLTTIASNHFSLRISKSYDYKRRNCVILWIWTKRNHSFWHHPFLSIFYPLLSSFCISLNFILNYYLNSLSIPTHQFTYLFIFNLLSRKVEKRFYELKMKGLKINCFSSTTKEKENERNNIRLKIHFLVELPFLKCKGIYNGEEEKSFELEVPKHFYCLCQPHT